MCKDRDFFFHLNVCFGSRNELVKSSLSMYSVRWILYATYNNDESSRVF